MDLLLGLLFTTLIYGLYFWFAYTIGTRNFTQERASMRWCAIGIVFFWIQIAVFYGLAVFHAFSTGGVLLIGTLINAILLQRNNDTRKNLKLLREDGRLCREAIYDIYSRDRFFVSLLFGIAGIRILRALIAPPLAWDSLTYHLYKAGRFIQEGGFFVDSMPDAWTYYQHFPHVGEILWSFVMLTMGSDALLIVVGILLWFSCMIATYACARELGAKTENAQYAALSIGFLPAVIHDLSAAYVDITLLCFLLLGLTFAIRLSRETRIRYVCLCAAAFALASGTKTLGIPIMAIAALWTLSLMYKECMESTQWIRCILFSLLLIAIPLTQYGVMYFSTGNPLYPFELHLGPLLLEGHPILTEMFRGHFLPFDSPIQYSMRLVFGLFLYLPWPFTDHLNWGLGSIYIIFIGLMGLCSLIIQKKYRLALLFAVIITAMVAVMFSQNMMLMRTLHIATIGRYFTIIIAILAIAGAVISHRYISCLWIAVLWMHGIMGLPIIGIATQGIQSPQGLAMTLALIPVTIILIAIVLLQYSRFSRIEVRTALIVGVLTSIAAIHAIRSTYRYPIYASTASDHHARSTVFSPATIWKTLDTPDEKRVAVASGWDEHAGHNWFLYPLLGSRFQNQIHYIPITTDGSIVDYRHYFHVKEIADFDAWIERLDAQQITHIAILHPAKVPEKEWVHDNPHLFSKVTRARVGESVLYEYTPVYEQQT